MRQDCSVLFNGTTRAAKWKSLVTPELSRRLEQSQRTCSQVEICYQELHTLF
jgi:hypothetical protein